MRVKLPILIVLSFLSVILLDSCKRSGCRKDVLCVDNYDAKAKKDGPCLGCTIFGAYNYCPEADDDNKQCVFVRQFYSEFGEHGWIDVWVSDSAKNSNIDRLLYEGRITNFPVNIPACQNSDSTLQIIRPPGEYFYQIETQTGIIDWGWAIYREEGCRLLDVY